MWKSGIITEQLYLRLYRNEDGALENFISKYKTQFENLLKENDGEMIEKIEDTIKNNRLNVEVSRTQELPEACINIDCKRHCLIG